MTGQCFSCTVVNPSEQEWLNEGFVLVDEPGVEGLCPRQREPSGHRWPVTGVRNVSAVHYIPKAGVSGLYFLFHVIERRLFPQSASPTVRRLSTCPRLIVQQSHNYPLRFPGPGLLAPASSLELRGIRERSVIPVFSRRERVLLFTTLSPLAKSSTLRGVQPAAQHKIVNLLKTLWDFLCVIMCRSVFNVWPRDAKRLDTPIWPQP